MHKIFQINEILDFIAKHLHATDDLTALCRVSRDWYNQAARELFKNFTIRVYQRSVTTLTEDVTIGLHKQASWVQGLSIIMTDISTQKEHIRLFLESLPELRNLKRMHVDYFNDDELMKAALMPLRTAAQLQDLTLSVAAWNSLKVQLINLTRLCILDLPKHIEDEVVIPAQFSQNVSQLVDLQIGQAAFEEHTDTTGLPQLRHLTLHRSRRIGHVTSMCKYLKTLEMKDCVEEQVIEVVSVCSEVQTLKIILKGDSILSKGLVQSFYPTAPELRNLWVEGSNEIRQQSMTFLKVDPEDWCPFMEICLQLRVLSVDYPFGIHVESDEGSFNTSIVTSNWLQDGRLTQVLGSTIKTLRRLILRERPDAEIIDPKNTFGYEEDMFDIGRSRSRMSNAGKISTLEVWVSGFLYTVDTSDSVHVEMLEELEQKDFAGEDLTWTEGV